MFKHKGSIIEGHEITCRFGFSPRLASIERYEPAISEIKSSRVEGRWSSSRSLWKVQRSCPKQAKQFERFK